MGKRQKMTENVHSESNYLLLAIQIFTVDIEFTLPTIYLIACVTHISTLNIQKLWIKMKTTFCFSFLHFKKLKFPES